MRVVFLGMPGAYAPPHLAALLAAGVHVVALIVPAPPGAPPVMHLPPPAAPAVPPIVGPPPGLLELAGRSALPVLAVRRMRHPAVAATLAALTPDLACVACWPWRIPPGLLALPQRGWLNSHPSLLPALRGPAPLAEALQLGMPLTGVTIHWMDAGFDTGDIALQTELPLAAGMRLDQAEERAAAVGAQLLVETVRLVGQGVLLRRPQPPA